MKVIACYNIKGGVGKTATTVNLSHLASVDGARTLVLDLDPQGAASFYFRNEGASKKTAKALVQAKGNLEYLVESTDYANLWLIPADLSFRHLDLMLDDEKKRRSRCVLSSNSRNSRRTSRPAIRPSSLFSTWWICARSCIEKSSATR